MNQRDTYCSCCGAKYKSSNYPKKCEACGNIAYLNPIPVAIVLIPVDDRGLLLVRRGIEPGIGKLAIPGGFMDLKETWQEAGAREIREETGIIIDHKNITLFSLISSPNGRLLTFCLSPKISSKDIPPFQPNEETQELVIATEPTELVFPIHTQIMKEFYNSPYA